MKLQNKWSWLPGNAWIGLAIAEACGKQGAKIVICSRNETAVDQTIDALTKKGVSISGTTADVSNGSDITSLMQHSLEKWGKIDVWINNAGLSSGMRAIHEMSEQEIKDVVSVNLTGTLMAAKLILPYFVKNKGGYWSIWEPWQRW